MASLFEDVQAARSEMRRNADNVIGFNILTLLVGELETAAKRDGSAVTDDKVIAAAKKLIKSNSESIRLGARADKLEKENDVLQKFLPQELTADQIHGIIVASSATNIGEAMKALNDGYAGKFDKRLASQVAKQILG